MQRLVFELKNQLTESQMRLVDLVAATLPSGHAENLLKVAGRSSATGATAAAPAESDGK